MMQHPKYDRKSKRLLRRPKEYQSDRFKAALPFVRGSRRTALDIGAHIGMWSVQLVRVFARVVAIEPHPDSFECLSANLVDPKAYMRQVALGAAPGGARMYAHGLAAHVNAGDETGPFVDVNIVTLDSLDETEVDFLKIDVEGFETFVVRGGEETIRRDRPVIVIEQKYEQRYGLKDLAAVTLLKKWGAVVEWQNKNDYCLRWK